MTNAARARIAGILAICLLVLSAPGAMAEAGSAFQPDAQIRRGSGSYVGNDVINPNSLGQAVTNTGVFGQRLTFFISIENDGFNFVPESFKVRRSGSFDNGYQVRYHDASNNDVTGQVNTGTFTTPPLDAFGVEDYVMRVTVRIRPQATLCSLATRLMTVSSISDPSVTDAVRFTAALATPEANCPPVARSDVASITEDAVSNVVTGNLLANDTDADGDVLELGVFQSQAPFYGETTAVNKFGYYSWELDNTNPAVDALNTGETLTQVILVATYDLDEGDWSALVTLKITIHGHTD